jgi:hypothetical protein
MGMEHIIRFPCGKMPQLSQVMKVLADHKIVAQIRMVDGELTMPDEVPSEGWREVRLGTPSGMVTIARRDREFHVVTWGNADKAMQHAWNVVAWAAAKAGDGRILRPEAEQDPDEFRMTVDLPDVPRP